MYLAVVLSLALQIFRDDRWFKVTLLYHYAAIIHMAYTFLRTFRNSSAELKLGLFHCKFTNAINKQTTSQK